jgi:streptogramin lyase
LFDPEGNIWFSTRQISGAKHIEEMTQQGTILRDYEIPSTSSGPDWVGPTIVLGPDDNIWYTDTYTNDLVGRLTPDGQITEFPVPGDALGPWGAAQIINGPDGNLWFEATGASYIGSITLAGVIQLFPVPDPAVRGLTSGPDGNFWMTAATNGTSNEILRVNSQGQLTGQFPIPTLNSGAYAMAVGSDGAIWFGEINGNQIGRIATDGTITEYSIPTPNSGSGLLTRGPDRNIWFSENYANQIGEVVLQTDTNTTVTASANPSVVNQSVTFTAVVTPQAGSGTPTGTVQFQIDGVNSGNPVPLSGGQATISTAALTVGAHTITAFYCGDPSFIASTGSLSQSVQSAQQQIGGTVTQVNNLVSSGALNSGNGNALIVKLNSATASLNAGNITAGVNQLNAFINQVNAFKKSGTLTSAQAQALINAANLAIAAAQGSGAHLTNDTGGSTTSTGDTQPVTTAGQLVTGVIGVYLDNADGTSVPADEQARFDDAIAMLDTTFGAYGVDLVDLGVGDAADAIVRVQITGTSAAGSAADGVLGCTVPGNITLLTGWNWYTGADATAVGADQYDFETIVMHELGHAIGLAHSGDTNSVMYAYLAPGQTRRIVTAPDLSVLDSGSGGAPEPLTAATWRDRSSSASEVRITARQPTEVRISFVVSILSEPHATQLFRVALDGAAGSLPDSGLAKTDTTAGMEIPTVPITSTGIVTTLANVVGGNAGDDSLNVSVTPAWQSPDAAPAMKSETQEPGPWFVDPGDQWRYEDLDIDQMAQDFGHGYYPASMLHEPSRARGDVALANLQSETCEVRDQLFALIGAAHLALNDRRKCQRAAADT